MDKEKAPEKANRSQSVGAYITQARLPEELAERAKEYSFKTGASINAIICIALEEFLRNHNV